MQRFFISTWEINSSCV